jgi:hypothetical protein
MVDENVDNVTLLRLLTGRMERLSADSHWARRASGIRGNIVKVLAEMDAGVDIPTDRLNLLIETAFEMLRRAARDIPDIDTFLKQFGRD